MAWTSTASGELPFLSLSLALTLSYYLYHSNYPLLFSPPHSYETSNGITRNEEGVLKPGAGEDEGTLAVTGSTSWTAPDGKKYEISFTADETGYHPSFKLVA